MTFLCSLSIFQNLPAAEWIQLGPRKSDIYNRNGSEQWNKIIECPTKSQKRRLHLLLSTSKTHVE